MPYMPLFRANIWSIVKRPHQTVCFMFLFNFSVKSFQWKFQLLFNIKNICNITIFFNSACISLTKKKGQTSKKKVESSYNYETLTLEVRSWLKIKSANCFLYYYTSSKNVFKDFVCHQTLVCSKSKKMAKRTATSIKSIWRELDEDMSLTPNALASPDKLDDY